MGTPEIIARLDDGSRIHLVWLRDGAWSLQRFKSGDFKDGHGWLLTESGVIDASTVSLFLAAAEPHPDGGCEPPPRAA